MRTTINIDAPILKEIKALQKREKKPLGVVVSELLAVALKIQKGGDRPGEPFSWISHDMGALYDPADREAILDAMDRSDRPPRKKPRGSG